MAYVNNFSCYKHAANLHSKLIIFLPCRHRAWSMHLSMLEIRCSCQTCLFNVSKVASLIILRKKSILSKYHHWSKEDKTILTLKQGEHKTAYVDCCII